MRWNIGWMALLVLAGCNRAPEDQGLRYRRFRVLHPDLAFVVPKGLAQHNTCPYFKDHKRKCFSFSFFNEDTTTLVLVKGRQSDGPLSSDTMPWLLDAASIECGHCYVHDTCIQKTGRKSLYMVKFSRGSHANPVYYADAEVSNDKIACHLNFIGIRHSDSTSFWRMCDSVCRSVTF